MTIKAMNLANIATVGPRGLCHITEGLEKAFRNSSKENIIITAVMLRVLFAVGTLGCTLFTVISSSIDMVKIWRNMRQEHHAAILTIAKVQFVYLRVVLINIAFFALNTICPELMMTGTYDLRNVIKNSVTSFWKNYLVSTDMVLHFTAIDKTLLPDAGARFSNYSDIFVSICSAKKDPLEFEQFLGACAETIRPYYSDAEISLAHRGNRQHPVMAALLQNDRNQVETLIQNGASLIEQVRGESIICECIETKMGQKFLLQLLLKQPLEDHATLTMLKRYVTWNNEVPALFLINRIEELPQERQPSWWKKPEERAAFFVRAAFFRNKTVAQKFSSAMNAHVQCKECQNKTAFMAACAAGWGDLAEGMLQQGMDFSLRDFGGKTVYEYAQALFSNEKIREYIVTNNAHAANLIFFLIKKQKIEDARQIFDQYMSDGTIYTWENRAIVTPLYFASMAFGRARAQKRLLPYVDFVEQGIFSEAIVKFLLLAPVIFEKHLRELDFKKYEQVVPLIACLMRKEPDLGERLLWRLTIQSTRKKALWRNYPKPFFDLLEALVDNNKRDAARKLLPFIDASYEPQTVQQTILSKCVAKDWDDLVIVLIRQGALLHSVDDGGHCAFDDILQRCPDEIIQSIASQYPKERMKSKNQKGETFFSYMADGDKKCGLFAAKIAEVLIPLGVPEALCSAQTSVASIREFVKSRAYLDSTVLTQQQKEEALLRFFIDPLYLHYQNLVPYENNPAHMKENGDAQQFQVAPLPVDYNLCSSAEEVLQYILPLWPDGFCMYDDNEKRTKEVLVNKIRNSFELLDRRVLTDVTHSLLQTTNQTMLKNLYGNIFIQINKRLKAKALFTQGQNEQFDREVKSFVQTLGISFFHCADRTVANSLRYYLHFVANVQSSVEAEDEAAIDKLVHTELVQWRRKLFTNAFCAIKTNKDDSSTERYMTSYFNKEFGLFFPSFTNEDSHERMAQVGKKDEIRKEFLKKYTPVCIANYLERVISSSMKNPQAGHKWYAKIQAFLENKHPNINWNEVFDLEANTITPKGLELLLVDLAIVT